MIYHNFMYLNAHALALNMMPGATLVTLNTILSILDSLATAATRVLGSPRSRIQFYIIGKDVNEYLDQYSNIRIVIRILFEYSMVNDIIFLL